MENQYTKVLKDYKIRLSSVIHLSMWRRGFSSTAKDTLVLTTDNEADPISWKGAATDIYDLIDEVARPAGLQFRVEIRNPEMMYQDRSSGVTPGSNIHRALLAVQPLVEAEVVKIIPLHMRRVVSYRMRGLEDQLPSHKPTVMVLVEPNSHHCWHIVEAQIEAAINSVKSHDIKICLEFGTSLLCPSVTQDVEPSRPIALEIMPEIARNGASIGPQMTMDAGSLGVWVWFQPKGNSERTPCFLTCYNVIASGEGDPERRKRNDIEGIGLKEAVGPNPIKVDYPAPFDAAVTKKDFESKIEKGDDLDKANTRSLEIFNQYMSENGIGRVE